MSAGRGYAAGGVCGGSRLFQVASGSGGLVVLSCTSWIHQLRSTLIVGGVIIHTNKELINFHKLQWCSLYVHERSSSPRIMVLQNYNCFDGAKKLLRI